MAQMETSAGLPEGFTKAEAHALEATKLEAFPINLLEVRRTVDLILGEFGRHGFFDEYTVHNFSHCVEMLRMLDWIVPTDTQKIMSPGDWLFVVLAVYLHDVGLLITKEEYAQRENSTFPAFKANMRRASSGDDYFYKISKLSPDEQERFLYQEFVRNHHGSRVRTWIEGKAVAAIGVADAARSQLQELLSSLSIKLRRDLAIVCESHNLDDLDNTAKYKVSQPYGNSAAETVNPRDIKIRNLRKITLIFLQ